MTEQAKPPGPFGWWSDAIVAGYVAAYLKGNPHRSHAKKPGEQAAACGKRPGPSTARMMRRRVGWYVATDGREPQCNECRAAITKATGTES